MLKNSILIVLVFVLSSCASIPKGERALIEKVELDAKSQLIKESQIPDIQLGRPKFVRAYAYPQLIDGEDLFEGGFVNLFVGRETLSLEDLLKEDAEEKSEDVPRPN